MTKKVREPQWKILWSAMKHKKRKLTALDGFKLCGTMNMHKRGARENEVKATEPAIGEARRE